MDKERKSLWKSLVNNGFLGAIFVMFVGIITLIYVLI